MKKEDIYDAMTNIEPELIEEADKFTFRKKRKILPVILSFAAVLVIVFAANALYNLGVLTGIPETHNTLPDNNTEDTTQITQEVPQTFAPGSFKPPAPEQQTEHENAASENEERTTSEALSSTDVFSENFSNPHTSTNKKEIKPTVLADAAYPKMSAYPVLLGEMSPLYDSWREDISKLRRIEVETDNILSFSKTLMSEVLTDSEDKNNIVSPLNIYMALCILSETCDGNSRQQILSLLGASSVDELREQANKVWQKNYRDDGYMKSIMSNSLWLNDSVMYKKSAVTTIAEKYYASVFSGTMGSQKYDKMLKGWIEDNTDGLISPDISMNYDDVMSIASTILFQTKWTNKFSSSKTEKGIFRSPDKDINIDFMKKTENTHYFWGEKFAAINLPLDIGGKMWFILPDEGVDVDDIFKEEQLLSLVAEKDIYGSYENSKYIKVNMAIPRFDASSEKDLLSNLKKLGVTDIADEQKSDFSPLATNPEGIFIDKVSHGVRVKIDEEGVSAAAYTVIRGAGAAAPPDEEVDFVLDRPFAFVITLDNETPLFAGIVNNP